MIFMNNSETLREKFKLVFGYQPSYYYFVPYRICTLGAHIDHQKGIINGFTPDIGVNMVFSPNAGKKVNIYSEDYAEKASFDISNYKIEKGRWISYSQAALSSLKDYGYEITRGFDAIISGSFPVGGLSSSAAVTIQYINAFCTAGNYHISNDKLITVAHGAERNHIGLNCGVLDQACIVLSKKDCLLYYDTLTGEIESIPFPSQSKKFRIGIFFSGVEHSLTSSDYNKRTAELREGFDILRRHTGIKEDSEPVLRRIPADVFEKYGGELPDNVYRRCLHYYTEIQRVKEGTKLFREGKTEEYGRLITESGQSSVENYEAGSPELTALWEILKSTRGVLGARFCGAGFKGNCFALADPDFEIEIEEKVKEAYLRAFPSFKDKYKSVFTGTTDGTGVNNSF